MHYSPNDFAYIEKAIEKSSSRHLKILQGMLQARASLIELFAYGMRYLPRIRDEKTGKTNLEKLSGYVPEIVEYFHTVSELPSVPDKLKDVATDFAAYADGECVQTDKYYYGLDPEAEMEKALRGNLRA